jgi:hypothetical protein
VRFGKKPKGAPGVKMDVTAGVKQSIAIFAAVAGLVAFLLVAWIGGELRYGNCLSEVELRHPVVLSGAEAGAAAAAREDEIDDCSRWF